MSMQLENDREKIAMLAAERLEENDAFRAHLQSQQGDKIDKLVHQLNADISPLIDCTTCGACCRTLMINVEEEEILPVAANLGLQPSEFKLKYIEQSLQGQMIINTIPCHFLKDSKCNVYGSRFTECREFPHLHRSNFKGRLFGTLIHYAICPIIFNVVEELKSATGFKKSGNI